jgi:hypothetical protein
MKATALLPLSKVVINKSNLTEESTPVETDPVAFGRWGRPVRLWISLAGLLLAPLPALQSATATQTNLIATPDSWCWLPEDNRALRAGDSQIVAASKASRRNWAGGAWIWPSVARKPAGAHFHH